MSELDFTDLFPPVQAGYLEWFDRDMHPLLQLHDDSFGTSLHVTGEKKPTLSTAGTFLDVAGTGTRLHSGPDALRGSAYTVEVFAQAGNALSLDDLEEQVAYGASRTRWVQKRERLLPVLGATIERVQGPSRRQGATVTATFETALPYWLGPVRTVAVAPGAVRQVLVSGRAERPLRVLIHAGGTDVVNPSVESDAGLTTWQGTVPAGQTLVIDASPGVWSVTLAGVDVRERLLGFQPLLRAGTRDITVTAPGATAEIQFREGFL